MMSVIMLDVVKLGVTFLVLRWVSYAECHDAKCRTLFQTQKNEETYFVKIYDSNFFGWKFLFLSKNLPALLLPLTPKHLN
jgi:hypothetical protein